ncbi:sugar ABC transporter permease [Halobacteria archaeon AArc-curdl1]|uniref:Sugar ABC transporter permease n=1 Tax=Natronosalvus hydrolyticus TaxID=2979988 RepID=A0AAP3E7W7_9EURY|nr:sugar ABC transporter permease [Halobacteria archaeon AArc-curdl1]
MAADGGTATSTGFRVRDRLDRLRFNETLQAALFWVPPALLMGWFVYGAISWNFVISLTDWSGLGQPDYASLNLEMYWRMLDDRSFIAAARNTVALLVVFTGGALVVGLLLAILVDQDIRFENTFRTIYLLPMSLSFVVTAIFWAWMYNPETGMINVVLRGLGLEVFAMNWMSDPRTKLATIIVALTWQFSGYCMIVYLAGLRAIPDEHYEAAKVDGASTVRMYWRVIIPQLRAATTSAAVVLMVFALKAFDFIFVMYGTTPGPSADILAIMMFREAFARTNWAYGSAIAMVLFLMALAIIAPYIYVQYRRGEL